MRFIPSTWLHRPQENRLPGRLCDEAPMVADGPLEPTVAAKWQPRDDSEYQQPPTGFIQTPGMLSDDEYADYAARFRGGTLTTSLTLKRAALPDGADEDGDTPPMLLLARMRQRLDFVRQSLHEVTNDRDKLNDANGRLVAREKAALDEAESLRTALAHVGRQLEQERALVATLTRQVNALNPAGMAMHTADDQLLIQPLPAQH